MIMNYMLACLVDVLIFVMSGNKNMLTQSGITSTVFSAEILTIDSLDPHQL